MGRNEYILGIIICISMLLLTAAIAQGGGGLCAEPGYLPLEEQKDLPAYLQEEVESGYVVLKKNLEQQLAAEIAGVVTDGETGDVLPGANVSIEGTTTGASTDTEGRYRIANVEPGTYTLVATFVGYQESSQEITVSEGQEAVTVDFTLQPAAMAFDEMVVVGYGTQERSGITGSISSVSADEVSSTPTSGVQDALQGRVAGVNITPSTGQPGAPLDMNIRGVSSFGNNNPLFVVDGVPVFSESGGTINPLATLNPDNIESVEILKDASAAAIYGARAANGRGGFANLLPTQEIVDEYEDHSGATGIDGRDPRLSYSIFRPGDDYDQIEPTFRAEWTPTGYAMKKGMYPVLRNVSASPRNIVLIRLADVLLMYAEAANENGKPGEAIDAINSVRQRVGMPALPTAEYTVGNQEQIFEAIVHERRVELAFEYHRLNDLKRWGLAEEELESSGYDSPKHRYFPIPQQEINTNSELEQNPNY